MLHAAQLLHWSGRLSVVYLFFLPGRIFLKCSRITSFAQLFRNLGLARALLRLTFALEPLNHESIQDLFVLLEHLLCHLKLMGGATQPIRQNIVVVMRTR